MSSVREDGLREGMVNGHQQLAPGGELRIGSVILAGGRRIISDYGSYDPLAWATTQPVPDAGMAWSALSPRAVSRQFPVWPPPRTSI